MTITASNLFCASRYEQFVDVIPVAAEVEAMITYMYSLATALGIAASTALDGTINRIVTDYIETRFPLAEPVNLSPLRPLTNLAFSETDIQMLLGTDDQFRKVWYVR